MKKITILLALFLAIALVSPVGADSKKGLDDKGPSGWNRYPVEATLGQAKLGNLFLFQKCDDSLKNTSAYDGSGCPTAGNGPWPILLDNRRYGMLNHSLWGDEFKFSFVGQKLLPNTNYTLIYYPDPWPGEGLICLGGGKSNPAGNLALHGSVETGTSLPAQTDANYNPISPSGAVGAKIWLVLSQDVKCGEGSLMINWNPGAYLFEYNLIVFEHFDDDNAADDDVDD
jgi:hypothetical protein